MIENKNEHCFIITPIGDEADPIRRHIEGIIDAAISPALNNKYDIIVAHKISEPGSITKQIISEIYEAKLVIANLTNRNPNVMYELALRHAIGKPVIMIAEKGTNLPSDIIMQRVIFYHNDAKGVLELRDNIINAEHEIDFSNIVGPIVEVLGDINHDSKALQQVNTVDSNDIEPFKYILHRLNRIEEAITVSRHRPTRELIDDKQTKRRVFIFKFEKSKLTYNKKLLENKLTHVTDIDSNAKYLSMRVDDENKIIIIELLLTDLIDVPEIYQYFYKVLSDSGFENLSTTKSEICLI